MFGGLRGAHFVRGGRVGQVSVDEIHPFPNRHVLMLAQLDFAEEFGERQRLLEMELHRIAKADDLTVLSLVAHRAEDLKGIRQHHFSTGLHRD